MNLKRTMSTLCCLLPVALSALSGMANADVKMVGPIGEGWARSSVNAAIFRTSSVVSHGDTQYLAYYDAAGSVILAKRKLGTTTWEVKKTPYTGTVKDAHNIICLGMDGNGVLHMVWDLHNQAIRYVRSKEPGSLELTEPLKMTGDKEVSATYPQFYTLQDGDLLFLYREGSSGDGDTMLNRYDLQKDEWQIVAHPLIEGEGKRNAYVNQMAIDGKGGWHLSWCWRETPDVATNHDVCYAYSPDEGKTWQKTSGQKYTLPITAATAEVAWPVPPNSVLMNQTSMTVDANNHPLIASYWRPRGTQVPQYQLVWHDGKQWRLTQVGTRKLAFNLSGGGTKVVPISRPQVLAGTGDKIYVIFRDEERGNGISVATAEDAEHANWQIVDVHQDPMGAWEPTYDPALWKRDHQLHLFFQRVGQGDAETLSNIPPQQVGVLEWTP